MSASLQLAHDLWGRSELPTALGNMAAAIDGNTTQIKNTADFFTPVSARAPLVTDGAPLYNVGDIWLAPAGSPLRLYQLANNTVGASLWTPMLSANALPLDILTASAAYGVVKLRAAYAGNCIRVINGSAVTLDIPFNAGTGMIDTAILDAHLAGATGAVDIIYDHTANALDATQTVAANRPIISVNTIGGARVVVFDSVPVTSGTPPAVSKFMNIPVGLSIVPRTACIIAAGQNYYGGMTSVWAQLGVPTDFQANCSSSVLNGAPNYPACLSINGGLGAGALATGSAFNVPSRADPAVYVWNCNTNNASYYANNHIQSGVTNTGRGAVAVTTGQIGTSTGGTTTGNLMFGAMLFYPTAPTTVQIDNIRGSLCRLFNIAPQTMDAVVTFGDSVAAGQAGALGRNAINQSIPMLSIPMREYNLATSGSSVGPASTNAAALAKVTPNLQRIYNSSLRNFVVVLSSGANDIVSGRTPGQILGDIASFFQQAAAFGPNVKRVVCTIIPNGAFTPVPSVSDTERQTVNTMIRAQWPSFADALCDHAANPIMGDGVDLTDTTLFSDTIHCTALGYSYLAIQRAGVINTLLT